MSTLAEIEAAAESLPTGQQKELLTFLAMRLGGANGSSGELCEQKRQQRQCDFTELTATWREETALMSSLTQMCTHPAYQRIVGMGETALPFIFRELQSEPDHWFWALKAITGCDPVPRSHQGDLDAMASDWLAWGRSKGYVTP